MSLARRPHSQRPPFVHILAAMSLRAALRFALLGQLVLLSRATVIDPAALDACPGYRAKNVFTFGPKLTADLVLAGKACNVFGPDIEQLKLEVTYETSQLTSFLFVQVLY